MDAEDTAALVLRLDGPALAEIHLDCVRRGYARGCTIVGSEGDRSVGLAARSSHHCAPMARCARKRSCRIPMRAYLAELDAFLKRPDAAPPMASLADGRARARYRARCPGVVGVHGARSTCEDRRDRAGAHGIAPAAGQGAGGYRRAPCAGPCPHARGRHYASRRCRPGHSGIGPRTIRSSGR